MTLFTFTYDLQNMRKANPTKQIQPVVNQALQLFTRRFMTALIPARYTSQLD